MITIDGDRGDGQSGAVDGYSLQGSSQFAKDRVITQRPVKAHQLHERQWHSNEAE